MKIKIKIEPGAFQPRKSHSADAGLDIFCPVGEGQTVPAKESAVFNTGIKIQIPRGYVGFLKSRSGLNINYGITGDSGVIDSGYTGTVLVKLYNNSGYDYDVKPGDRISQLVILPILEYEVECSEDHEEESEEEKAENPGERGSNGFGSTGR